MPIVSIIIPEECGESQLEEVERRIKKTVASIRKLRLVESQVSVLFPKNKLKKRKNIEIIAKIEGLFESPERTAEVRKILAENVVSTLAEFFSEAILIECIVIPFNVEQGFASLIREEKWVKQ